MSKKNKAEELEEIISEEQAEQQSETATADEAAVVSEEEALRVELEKERDKFLRLFAEFENYKKRTSKERMDLFKTAGQEVLTALLPVLDDFDRALNEISKSEDKEMFKGVELISNK